MSKKLTTLADIVTQQPEAAKVFARHGLDFCCHGQRPLDEACGERGLSAEAVMREVDAAGSVAEAGRWDERPLPELIDHILERYHAPLLDDIDALITMARKVESVHAAKRSVPTGLAAHLEGVRAAVETHLAKEEQILFPMIKSGQGAMASMPVKVMMREHEDHGANLQRIRAKTNDLVLPDEACATWRALYSGLEKLEMDLFEHIHLENNVLFPRALVSGEDES